MHSFHTLATLTVQGQLFMFMWDIRLNWVVLHASEQVLQGILKSPPAHLLKCVIKSTQMNLFHFDVGTTKKKKKFPIWKG